MAKRKGAYARLTLKRNPEPKTLDDLLILLFTNGKEEVRLRPEVKTTIKAAKKFLKVVRYGPRFPVEDWDGSGLPASAWVEFVIYELLADEYPREARELGEYLAELRRLGRSGTTIKRNIEKKAASLGVLNEFWKWTKAYIKARRYLLDAGLIEKRNDVYNYAPGGFIRFLNKLTEIVTADF